MEPIKADPLALNAVICAVLKGPNTTPDDFKRATLVDSFSMIYQKFPDWAEPTSGATAAWVTFSSTWKN
ncbi:hypothetical protein AALB19_04175 [Oscillospiraceae bacterium 50-58]